MVAARDEPARRRVVQKDAEKPVLQNPNHLDCGKCPVNKLGDVTFQNLPDKVRVALVKTENVAEMFTTVQLMHTTCLMLVVTVLLSFGIMTLKSTLGPRPFHLKDRVGLRCHWK